jgi:hypothetical protein
VLLADGSWLYEALRGGKFVLLSATPYAAAEYADRLVVVTPQQAMPTTLVRPDGYVAWRGPAPEVSAAVRQLTGLSELVGAV